MMTVEQFAAFRRRIESEQAEYERSRGALAQLLERMKAEFGVSSVEEADERLDGLKKEMADLGERLENRTEELKRLWAEYKDGTSKTC